MLSRRVTVRCSAVTTDFGGNLQLCRTIIIIQSFRSRSGWCCFWIFWLCGDDVVCGGYWCDSGAGVVCQEIPRGPPVEGDRADRPQTTELGCCSQQSVSKSEVRSARWPACQEAVSGVVLTTGRRVLAVSCVTLFSGRRSSLTMIPDDWFLLGSCFGSRSAWMCFLVFLGPRGYAARAICGD